MTPERKRATYHTAEHPGFMMIAFLLLSVLLSFLIQKYWDSSVEPWQAWFACSLFWISAAWFGIRWMHQVYFTPDGLQFCRFGKPYRFVEWSRITQAGIAKEYKATRLTLVFTPEGCPKYNPEYTTPTTYVEQYRFKLVLLHATKENIAMTKQFYGELDYSVK